MKVEWTFFAFLNTNFDPTPDGQAVCYEAKDPISGKYNLFAIGTDGLNRVPLAAAMGGFLFIGDFSISEDQSKVSNTQKSMIEWFTLLTLCHRFYRKFFPLS